MLFKPLQLPGHVDCAWNSEILRFVGGLGGADVQLTPVPVGTQVVSVSRISRSSPRLGAFPMALSVCEPAVNVWSMVELVFPPWSFTHVQAMAGMAPPPTL